MHVDSSKLGKILLKKVHSLRENSVAPAAPQTTNPISGIVPFVTAATSILGLSQLWSAASQAGPGTQPAAMLVQSILGAGLNLGGRLLSRKITGASLDVLGGEQKLTRQGSGVYYKIQFNVPEIEFHRPSGGGKKSSLLHPYAGNTGGAGSGETPAGAVKTLPIPGMQHHVARVEAEPDSEGYVINLFRDDPIHGIRAGAPVKSIAMNFRGGTPGSARRLEDQIAKAIADMGNSLLFNKQPRTPPPHYGHRGPGRPPARFYH